MRLGVSLDQDAALRVRVSAHMCSVMITSLRNEITPIELVNALVARASAYLDYHGSGLSCVVARPPLGSRAV
jgi:hypothetical protein